MVHMHYISELLASSPGHSQFFNVTRRKTCNIEKWVWPGDEASELWCIMIILLLYVLRSKCKFCEC